MGQMKHHLRPEYADTLVFFFSSTKHRGTTSIKIYRLLCTAPRGRKEEGVCKEYGLQGTSPRRIRGLHRSMCEWRLLARGTQVSPHVQRIDSV